MAKVGLKNLVFAVMTPATEAYGTPESLGKAVTSNLTVNTSSSKLYADNRVVESDSAFTGGTLSVTVDDGRKDVFAKLLGHTVDGTSGEVVSKASDAAPYVGVGQIVNKTIDGATKYEPQFLCKVKFAEPSTESGTKGESVEFKTATIEGDVVTLADGETWRKMNVFDTYAEAESYLNTCFGYTP